MKHFLTTIFFVVNTFCGFSQDSKISTVSDVFKWKQMGFIGSYQDKNYVKVTDNKETYTAVYDTDLKLVSKINLPIKVDSKERNIIDQVIHDGKIIYFVKEVNNELVSPELNAYIYDLNNTTEFKKINLATADISKVYTGVIGKKGYAKMGDFFSIEFSKNLNYFAVTYNYLDSHGPFKQADADDKITQVFSFNTFEKVTEYKQPNLGLLLRVLAINVDDYGKIYITYRYHLKNEDKEIQNKNLYFINIIDKNEVVKKIKVGEGDQLAYKSFQLTFDNDTFYTSGFKSNTSSGIITKSFEISEYNTKTLEKIRTVQNDIPNLYSENLGKKESMPYILKQIKKLANNDLLIVAEQYEFYYGYQGTIKVYNGNIALFKTDNNAGFKFIHKIPYYLDGLSMRKTSNSNAIVIEEGDTTKIMLEDNLENLNVIGDQNITDVSNFHADKNGIFLFTFNTEKLLERKLLVNQSTSPERILLRQKMFFKNNDSTYILPLLDKLGKLNLN